MQTEWAPPSLPKLDGSSFAISVFRYHTPVLKTATTSRLQLQTMKLLKALLPLALLALPVASVSSQSLESGPLEGREAVSENRFIRHIMIIIGSSRLALPSSIWLLY